MNPQSIHDAWLIVTVIATLSVSGVALFLWRMFRSSDRRWFFWWLAFVLASVAVEHVAAEVKNLHVIALPADPAIAWGWLAGRVQEAAIATAGLGYMVFGRNGKQH